METVSGPKGIRLGSLAWAFSIYEITEFLLDKANWRGSPKEPWEERKRKKVGAGRGGGGGGERNREKVVFI